MNILWAFDPFLANLNLQKKAKIILKSIVNEDDAVVAVYVASNQEVNLSTAYNIPKEIRYTEYPKKLLKRELIKLGVKKIKMEVIPSIKLSLSSSVKLLAQFAKKTNVDFILIASNGKKLFPRLVFGSFSETLVHLSNSDVMIYHQKTKINFARPKTLLYAHDFSLKGTAGLNRAMIYAKKWEATLIVVHVLSPEHSLLRKKTEGAESEAYRLQLLRQAQKLERFIRSENIDCSIHLVPTLLTPADTVLSVAKKLKANIIMMTAKSSNLVSFLGGDVTRKILRESTLLTLVIKV